VPGVAVFAHPGENRGLKFRELPLLFLYHHCRLRYRRHAHASSVFEVARLLDVLMCLAASSLGVLYRNAQGKNSTACGVSNNVTQAKTRVCACAVLETSSATTSFSQKNLKPRDSVTRLFIYWGETCGKRHQTGPRPLFRGTTE